MVDISRRISQSQNFERAYLIDVNESKIRQFSHLVLDFETQKTRVDGVREITMCQHDAWTAKLVDQREATLTLATTRSVPLGFPVVPLNFDQSIAKDFIKPVVLTDV